MRHVDRFLIEARAEDNAKGRRKPLARVAGCGVAMSNFEVIIRHHKPIGCDEPALLICACKSRKRTVRYARRIRSEPEPVPGLQLDLTNRPNLKLIAVRADIDRVLLAATVNQGDKVLFLWRRLRLVLFDCVHFPSGKAPDFGLFRRRE